ncbi:Uncharacterised protein [Streptococcus pneumoniae]|nr:Uncharacterised protein [Streptococcus pneumoniae]CEX37049.1 Uncharacterised protein [Streptococcus pneumoniae]CGG99806.1 Uncharacterised protein [Streptococcus pneumoniae]CIP53150.1 Uncharacterised protein [Streptococcus pneumoniae]CIR58867.1 Uncharacterised protein [Streptococcus pneumoniae]
MNYIICAYSIILMFSAYFGYKKSLEYLLYQYL